MAAALTLVNDLGDIDARQMASFPLGDSGVVLGEGKKAREALAGVGAGGHATHATAFTGRRLPMLEGVRTGYEAGPVSRLPGRSDDEQSRIPVHRDSPIGYGTRRGDL